MFVTEQEIMQQHLALKQTVSYLRGRKQAVREMFDCHSFRQIVFIGCGSSFMLAQGAANLFAMRSGIKTLAIAGGDLMLAPESYRSAFEDALVVLITRSGKTSEVLYALEKIRETSNAYVLCLHAQSGTVIPQQSDFELALDWAFDSAVCQTRNISNFYLALTWLYAVYAEDQALEAQLEAAAEQNEAFKLAHRAALEEIGKQNWKSVVVLADGELSGICSEGALAFNEICLKPGVYYHMLDFRHGPAVLANQETLMLFVLREAGMEKQLDMVADMKKKGAHIVTLSAREEVPGADLNLTVDPALTDYAVWGVPFIYLPQMIAFSRAVAEGINPDCPEGLDAFITL